MTLEGKLCETPVDSFIEKEVQKVGDVLFGKERDYSWKRTKKISSLQYVPVVNNFIDTVAERYKEQGMHNEDTHKQLRHSVHPYVNKIISTGKNADADTLNMSEVTIMEKPAWKRALRSLPLIGSLAIASHALSDIGWAATHNYKLSEFWVSQSFWKRFLHSDVMNYLQPTNWKNNLQPLNMLDEEMLQWYTGVAPLVFLGVVGIAMGSLYYFGSPARANRRMNNYRKKVIPLELDFLAKQLSRGLDGLTTLSSASS